MMMASESQSRSPPTNSFAQRWGQGCKPGQKPGRKGVREVGEGRVVNGSFAGTKSCKEKGQEKTLQRKRQNNNNKNNKEPAQLREMGEKKIVQDKNPLPPPGITFLIVLPLKKKKCREAGEK